MADTFNDVIRRNQELAGELARIGEVVGVEGRINQRASLGEMQGSWVEAIGSVNSLVENLVQPTSEMANKAIVTRFMDPPRECRTLPCSARCYHAVTNLARVARLSLGVIPVKRRGLSASPGSL